MATYEAVFAAGPWRHLRFCPGRSIWQGPPGLTPAALVGPDVVVRTFRVSRAADRVHVASFPGGGLISYEKAGGEFVHTLNTAAGFARKLADLGIEL